MKSLTIIVISLMLSVTCAQSQSSWVAKYGSKWFLKDSAFRFGMFEILDASGLCISSDNDNGYYVAGTTRDDFSGRFWYSGNAFVMRIDSLGKPLWARTLAGSKLDYGAAVTPHRFGCYVVGSTRSNDGDFLGLNPKSNGVFIISLSRYGSVEWTNVFPTQCQPRPRGSGFYDDGYQVLRLGTSILVVACDSIRRLSINGDVVWTIPNHNSSQVFSGQRVAAVSGKYFVVTGDSTVMYDGSGKRKWSSPVKGDYALAYGSSAVMVRSQSYWTLVDTLGNMRKSSIPAISKGQSAAFGNHIVELHGGNQDPIILTQRDSSGRVMWTRSLTGPAPDASQFGNGVLLTDDGGCVITGSTNNWGRNGDFFHEGDFNTWTDSSVFVIKLDKQGGLTMTDVGEHPQAQLASSQPNYPNPFTESTNIPFYVTNATTATIEIVNLLGVVVKVLDVGHINPGLNRMTFTRGDLPSGVYHYRILTRNEAISNTMVIIDR
jgi:hypothetical protein